MTAAELNDLDAAADDSPSMIASSCQLLHPFRVHQLGTIAHFLLQKLQSSSLNRCLRKKACLSRGECVAQRSRCVLCDKLACDWGASSFSSSMDKASSCSSPCSPRIKRSFTCLQRLDSSTLLTTYKPVIFLEADQIAETMSHLKRNVKPSTSCEGGRKFFSPRIIKAPVCRYSPVGADFDT